VVFLKNSKKVSIYGLGNFGYAILKHFDNKSEKDIIINAYDRNKNLIKNLKEKRKHLFFHKSVKISNKIKFVDNVKDLMNKCDVLILAVNSDSTREVLRRIKPHIKNNLIVVNTAKALDHKTGKRLSEIIQKEFHNKNYEYALIAGGTIAKDLFNQEPLGANLACENKKILALISNLFKKSNLVIYPTTDLKGVEYASALKNVVSILAGIIKGMNFSFGSETHIITRASSELEKIMVNTFGGRPETFASNSQCWTNDLWMSSLGNTRNKEFGVLLGKGFTVKNAISIMSKDGKTIEGLSTLKALKNIPELKKYPLMNFLYKYIVLESVSIEELKPIIFKGKF
jgi:glycerol-3-phosphate dehydrogenase (NAD(P)+)